MSYHSADRCNPVEDLLDNGGYTRPCVIHYPTNHHMRSWPCSLRDDKDWLVERHCEHGIGHPDPDSLYYFDSIGKSYMGIHGCCGCCAERPDV